MKPNKNPEILRKDNEQTRLQLSVMQVHCRTAQWSVIAVIIEYIPDLYLELK